MGNITCPKCGGPAQTHVWKGWQCSSCDQVNLLKEQNKIHREQLKVQQHALRNQSRANQNYYEDGQSYSPPGNNSTDSSMGTILAIGLGILMLVGIYKFFAWLFGWIWAIAIWPFKFAWQCFENIITSSTQLIGISHDPAWWQVGILIAVVSFGLFYLWNHDPSGSSNSNQSDVENQKIGITAITLLLLIACGIWLPPTAKLITPAVPTLIQTQENPPEQSADNVSQELTPKSPVEAHTPEQK
jgi:hypothetical protein